MEQKLQEKLLDYMCFSKILFYLSIFFFIRVFLDGSNQSVEQVTAYMLTAILSITTSLIFFHKTRKIQEQLDEI